MVRLLGGDKHKLVVWTGSQADKQWRRSLCRLYVIEVMSYLAAVIVLFTKRFSCAMHSLHLQGTPAESAMLSQPCRAELMNTRRPIGRRYE